MSLKQLDTNKLSALISLQVDQVTCIECRKYYIVPTTANCGHTLCHACWRWRKICASCGTQVDRKALKLNLHLQNQTEHAHTLAEEFERIFKVKLDDFIHDTPLGKESAEDATKNVKDWLASSENQFSAPQASQQSIQDVNIQQHNVSNKANIDKETSKTTPNKNTVYVEIPQDDWDKIEELPDTEEVRKKDSDNAVGPMDIEPFEPFVDQLEFTADNPRRSVRKRDVKGTKTTPKADSNYIDKNSTKNSSDTESKTVKSKQNWGNVKRMKKEFSKLNKKRNNKLNVSIEMFKKTQSSANKNTGPMPTINASDDLILNIDENTPVNNNNLKDNTVSKSNLGNNEKDIQVSNNSNNFQTDIEVHKVREEKTPRINQSLNQPTEHMTLLENKSKHSNASNNNKDVAPVPFIVKGAFQTPSSEENDKKNKSCNINNAECITVHTDNVNKGTDDIEITIKIGNTLTNICIKKKEKDVQLKINTDREVQTSLDKCTLDTKKNVCCSPIKEINSENDVIINIQNNEHISSLQVNEECISSNKNINIIKTLSSKKHTESADTATVQYEITESIEKELSKEMEKVDSQNTNTRSRGKVCGNKADEENDVLGEDCLNDLDLFENDSVKDDNVQLLKSTNHAPSEILVSSMKSMRSEKQIEKRTRDTNSDDLPASKKMKINPELDKGSEEIATTPKTQPPNQSKNFDQDSELANYDAIMGQVFANIDADMEDLEKKADEVKNSQSDRTKKVSIVFPLKSKVTSNPCDSIHGVSENVFSILEKENETGDIVISKNLSQTLGRQPTQKTQGIENDVELIEQELSTPVQNNDSDEIVEETPQKTESFLKVKQNSDGTLRRENSLKLKTLQLKRKSMITEGNSQNKAANTPKMSVIDISDITDDTARNSTHVTIIEAAKPRPTLETPLTITKFVDQIKHKSTPMARKSLNFDKENAENIEADHDQTLCPNSFLAARTTQEREFMSKAFEESPTSAKSPLTIKNLKMRTTKYCLAGTCLTPLEIKKLKLLCSLRNWDYVEKYTKELTHLVVGVDEERKSQRSVKYMCALAASKWIVCYEWVKKCLQLKKVVDEEPYEALDSTGVPGPRRSRVAKQKLFQGITFFCMPPFSVLDVDTLKEMLEAAGGRVVEEAKAVRVTGSSPALLLAEPEHTQEDRFIYLAMELGIVPVNFEWALNCLGSYTIRSIQELLLCPASLLPPATAQWPQALMAIDDD